MMEEFNEKFNKIKKGVADSTQQQVELMKMKSTIRKAEATMDNAYKEIGKLFFEQAISEISGEYMEYINVIRRAKTEILECEKKIAHISGIQYCRECSQKIKDTMKFCPNCGAKVFEMQESANDEDGEKQLAPIEGCNIIETLPDER